MKKYTSLILFLLLCALVLLIQVPGAVNATSVEETLSFSTFAQLQEYAADSYETHTFVKYTSEETLVIQEDLCLPERLCLDLGTAQLTVPAGVEFTVLSEDHTSSLSAGAVLVDGTLNCDYLEVGQALTVNGTLNNHNVIYLDSTTAVSGTGMLHAAQDWSMISCQYSVSDMADLKKAVTAAANTADETWQYILNLTGENMIIDESLTVPENCELYIDWTDAPATVTVAQGCVLELDCSSWVYAPLAVDGILINRGMMNIFYEDGGCLSRGTNGFYLGEGTIVTYSDASAALSDILPGFDPAAFRVTAYEAPVACQQLESICTHTLEDLVPAVTDPTCGAGGYTEYICPDCGDGYIGSPTAPTGLHTYTDAYDKVCDICGAERDAQIRTMPLYRLYNIYTLEHLFTSGAEERDMLASIGWTYEGIAWYVPEDGDPVYRLYNPYDDSHFYTVSTEEIDTLLPLGWQLDGIMCNSATAETGKPVYRLFNPYEASNYHHYTISMEECDMLVPLGWILEGIAWYGMSE